MKPSILFRFVSQASPLWSPISDLCEPGETENDFHLNFSKTPREKANILSGCMYTRGVSPTSPCTVALYCWR